MGSRILVLMAIMVMIAVVAEASSVKMARPGCRDRCGNISIPYPFGIGAGCFKEGFEVRCNDSVSPPILSLEPYPNASIEVADIFLSSGELRIREWIGRDCYNNSGKRVALRNQIIQLGGSGPYAFSYAKNKITVIGCDTAVTVEGLRNLPYMDSKEEVMYYGSCQASCGSMFIRDGDRCDGISCCQTTVPARLTLFYTKLGSKDNYTRLGDASMVRCGYAFIAEEGQYASSSSAIYSASFYSQLPIMVDWSFENRLCNASSCPSRNSECFNSPNPARVVGYICNCSAGYEGNPYLDQGCQDIDECAHPDLYPCKGDCINTPGNYTCSCPAGTTSADPKLYSCDPISRGNGLPLSAKLGLGLGIGLLVLLTATSWAYWGFQKRRLVQLKHKFFQQNGGLFLQQHLSSHQGSMTFRIFGEEELARATDNFGDHRILGRGGYGTVYKGTLEDGKVVAIKKSKMVDERQNKEFAKEMLILSQINHKNIVKLLGCCLEVEVPMLVYEYVPNGTLFDYIHHKSHQHNASLDDRLRVATEAAEALAYLHSFASPPILHGDIKSANILLDDNHMAKVADFGASILAPLDRVQLATVVQGTCGYLDPEYLQTCLLTEKSDVYSFGVVLAELLTGKKAFCFTAPEEERCLAMNFVTSVRENRLVQILDAEIVGEGDMVRLQEVAELVKSCLNLNGDYRPTMKEVAMVLQGLSGSGRHPWVPHPHNAEEAERLLGEALFDCRTMDSHSNVIRGNGAILDIEGGR